MRCHSVGSGTASQTQSATQTATQSFAAAHMIAVIRVCDEAGNMIEPHGRVGNFKESLFRGQK
jgi:hypothetical protein